MSRSGKGRVVGKLKPPERKHLGLTWLDRVSSAKERAMLPPGTKVRASSALVADGNLYVVVIQPPLPEGLPADYRAPIAVHVTHTERAGVVVAGSFAPTGKGRPPLIAELDEVVHQFARGRVMALMFDGSGIATGPAYYELVEIAGAVVPQAPGLTPPSA